MSSDWAKNYINIHKERQQQQQNAQTRSSLAQAGAPDMFQRILERIQQDIQTFHDAGVLPNLTFKERAGAGEFRVVHASSPHATLKMDLNIVMIQYEHGRLKKDGDVDRRPGALRIGSDLDGVVKVYRNGDSFTDVSEVSEFLLRPLLDHIDG